jgi:tRNA-2-methylthio-N6-dimethylallyladenosine synthase
MNKTTYHLITLGCQMNKADSERLASYLDQAGYTETEFPENAHLVVFVTCGIRQSAEDRVYGRVNQLRKKNPQALIVITGCLAYRPDVQRRLKGQVNLFMNINHLPKLIELLAAKTGPDQTDASKLYEIERQERGEKYLKIPARYESSYRAYIPIGNGCDNFCSYCVVPYARGREVYRPADEILAEVKELLKMGYKEINLIAQNVNSYHSGDYNFPRLLKEVASFPGNFWVRFSSSHPKDLSPDLIRVIATSKKVVNHLHLAVQSGDDEILKAMNRNYTVAHFKDLISRLRAARPEMAITTDVIVGFPGESEAQFNNTLKLFAELNFDLAYISRYSPRPGTVSWKMTDNVSSLEKKRREKILNDKLAATSLAANQKKVGKELIVLVDGQNAAGRYYGKSADYKTVFFEAPSKKTSLIGSFVPVLIKEALAFGLNGVLSEGSKVPV